jgi:hypothetical protein
MKIMKFDIPTGNHVFPELYSPIWEDGEWDNYMKDEEDFDKWQAGYGAIQIELDGVLHTYAVEELDVWLMGIDASGEHNHGEKTLNTDHNFGLDHWPAGTKFNCWNI